MVAAVMEKGKGMVTEKGKGMAVGEVEGNGGEDDNNAVDSWNGKGKGKAKEGGGYTVGLMWPVFHILV